jgi:hypothetical protein
VIGADADSEGKLELLRLDDPLFGQVGGPEWFGDHHFRIGKMLLERRIRAVLVTGYDELVAELLQIAAKAQLA